MFLVNFNSQRLFHTNNPSLKIIIIIIILKFKTSLYVIHFFVVQYSCICKASIFSMNFRSKLATAPQTLYYCIFDYVKLFGSFLTSDKLANGDVSNVNVLASKLSLQVNTSAMRLRNLYCY